MSSKKVKKIGEQIVFLNTTLTAISIIIFSFISYITFTGHNLKTLVNSPFLKLRKITKSLFMKIKKR